LPCVSPLSRIPSPQKPEILLFLGFAGLVTDRYFIISVKRIFVKRNIRFLDKNLLEITSLGTRLREIRKFLDLNQKDFCEFIGITRQNYLSRYENNEHEFDDSLKLKLVKTIEEKYKKRISLDWLITGTGDMFLQENEAAPENTVRTGGKRLPIYRESELPAGTFVVPLLDQRLSAGNGSYLPEEDEPKALIHVPAYLARYGDQIKALEVDGDSMYPTLQRGDMVVCDSCGWSGEGVYAVRMNGKGFVKRVTQKPGKVVLLSDNPKYPPLEEPAESQDIEIVGRVHCAITKIE
jgi:phage repressor protein C with HTH and peptisase S24 domain